MNAIERRALYNLIRMNWLYDPALAVESWQVEDYRALSLSVLFEKLHAFQIKLDRMSFVAYADQCDSPEDLTDHLVGDRPLSTIQEDQIYLIIFELWRRLMSEKPSLSVVCSELDYHIHQYDQQKLENPLALQDALTHFISLLDENVDQGAAPYEVMDLIAPYCANDIKTFLYDFISEQIDEDNEFYARELLDNLDPYLGHNKWFKLIALQLSRQTQGKWFKKIAEEIVEEHLQAQDLEFNLEFLSLIADMGDQPIFATVAKETLPLLAKEEDFQEFVAILIEGFHCSDREDLALELQTILDQRASLQEDTPLLETDEDLSRIHSILTG